MSDWIIFEGNRKKPHNGIREKLPPSPKWRQFGTFPEEAKAKDEEYWKKLQEIASKNIRDKERGEKFCIQTNQAKNSNQAKVIDAVNAALYLRRPLLVTGSPGAGKTSLAYAVAYQLNLGPVLLWPITARSTLQEGLYQYDAIARLQDTQFNQRGQNTGLNSQTESHQGIGQYIQLGAVGTAFLSSQYPRVLLIDEVDKSDINLPNELLNLFEEGEFEIPELVRLSKQVKTVEVRTKDGLDVEIHQGQIRCCAFPCIIMTSNGERDFPPAFLRRCLRVEVPSPTEDELKQIVTTYLEDEGIAQQFEQLIKEFIDNRNTEIPNLATDQLLNTIYLLTYNADESLKELLLNSLSSTLENR